MKKSNMAVALHRIRFLYKLRPFNLTESLIRYGKVILMKEETFCLLFILRRINLMQFSFPHTQSKLCSLPTHKSCSVWAGRIFPSGSDREGRIGSRIRQHRYFLYLRYLLSNFCCLPPSPPSLKLFVEQRQGYMYFAERTTLYAECRRPNDSEVQ